MIEELSYEPADNIKDILNPHCFGVACATCGKNYMDGWTQSRMVDEERQQVYWVPSYYKENWHETSKVSERKIIAFFCSCKCGMEYDSK